MVRLLTVLSATGLGCLLAAALGLMAAVQFDSPALAAIAISVLPALGAYVGGVRDRHQLTKIACYALVGWVLCYLLKPAVSRATKELTPDFELWWGTIAFAPGSLLGLIGAGFASRPRAGGNE
jgi:hypothetical protein